MNLVRSTLVLGILVSLSACSSASSSTTGESNPDSGAAALDDAGLTSDEMATFSSGGDSLAANQETVTLADSLFDFDPTINPTATPSANATAIGQNAQTNLGTACGTVSVSGVSVSVDFGAAPGCTLLNGNGPQVSGTVSLAVSASGSTTSIAMTLTDVVVNGEALAGTTTFSTTDGSTFNVTSTMTSGTKSDSANLTVIGASNSFLVSGTATVVEGSVSSDVTLTNVNHVKGACYATSGTMTVVTGQISETITFNANTPATGEVSITTGKRTTTSTLPAYGSCPSDSVDGGKR